MTMRAARTAAVRVRVLVIGIDLLLLTRIMCKGS
jgi:hypothetical protein